MSALSDTQKALGKVGGASLATLVLIGALERTTRAIQSLETTIAGQNAARVEQLDERQHQLDRDRAERETQREKELALQKDQAESLRRLLELREVEAARRGGH
jgi:hypothetical protein